MISINKQWLKLNLFYKILLWFWLSSILVIITIFYLVYLNNEKIHFNPLPAHAIEELERVKHRLINGLKRGERAHFLMKNRMRQIYLLDQDGADYFAKNVAQALAALHRQVSDSNMPQSVLFKRQIYLGGDLLTLDGQSYRLYTQRREPPFSGQFILSFFKEMAGDLLFAIFLISFPLSLLLSYVVTRPIRQLQKATLEMTRDLNQRNSLQVLLNRSDEFAELATDFDQMADHLLKLLKLQQKLLSDVSHELRSPLSRLLIAQAMAEQKQGSECHQDLARIKLEANRMNEMLSNLLTISQLESLQIKHQKQALDLCVLIKSVVEDGRFEAEQAKIDILCELPEKCLFNGNKESLLSGIENILRNAIKYAGEKGQIKCQLIQQAETLIFSIEDNGPGVESQQLDKLFDPFYRPQTDRDRKTGGVGLGLAIAKRAFALNQGEISAQNISPHGLKVSVVFKSVND